MYASNNSKYSDAFLIFKFFHRFIFTTFYYQHGLLFKAKLHSYSLAVYSYCFYCYILICRIINDAIIKAQEYFFINICTSHFIVMVRKGLLRVCVWEGVGDRTETAIFLPHSYGRQRCVFLVLLCSTGGPGAQSAGWWLSLQHLISNFSGPPTQLGAPSPFCLVWLSLPHLVYKSVRLQLSDFGLDWVI